MPKTYHYELYDLNYYEWQEARPVFYSVVDFIEFLGQPLLSEDLPNGGVFKKEQDSLVLRRTLADYEIEHLERATFLHIKETTTPPQGDAHITHLYYFINGVEVLPQPQGYAEEMHVKLYISFDPWTSFIIPKLSISITTAGDYFAPVLKSPNFMSARTLITQGNPFYRHTTTTSYQGTLPVPAGVSVLPISFPFSVDTDGATNDMEDAAMTTTLAGGRSYDLDDVVAAGGLTFIGIFAASAHPDNVLVLARPTGYDRHGLNSNFPLAFGADVDTLLNVNQIKSCYMDEDFKQTTPSGVTPPEVLNEVDLLRAYLVPTNLIAQNYRTRGTGYRVTRVGDNEGYSTGFNTCFGRILPDEDLITPLLGRYDAFTVSAGYTSVDAKYIDVGTPFTRLEIPVSLGQTPYNVRIYSAVSPAGLTLSMEAGQRRVEISQDFEIPTAANNAKTEIARNRWSTALQGVSHVGNIAIAASTGNIASVIGGTLSAADFVADIAKAKNTPAVIQTAGGNGHATWAYAMTTFEYDDEEITKGAIFLRRIKLTNGERLLVNKYGVCPKIGAVCAPHVQDFPAMIFPSNSNDKAKHFIKTAGAILTHAPVGASAQDVEKIQKIFNDGVLICKNPNGAAFWWEQ